MNKPRNTFRSLVLFVLLNSVVINAYSISISTRRLYLDPKSNSTFIRVHNMEPAIQSCEVKVIDIAINNLGNITLVTNDKITKNSAKPLVRLAPRRFNLTIGEYQMVKLLYRRKPGIENGEYQGALAIKCTERKESSNEQVTITPALVHNVPLIVRTGRLPIQAEFVSTKINGNKLQVEFKIQGQRSLTGDFTVIDNTSGEIIAEQKHVSIYSQSPIKKLELLLVEYQNTPLMIKFTENPEMGGNLMIQQPVN
jgi:hypothetical protein